MMICRWHLRVPRLRIKLRNFFFTAKQFQFMHVQMYVCVTLYNVYQKDQKNTLHIRLIRTERKNKAFTNLRIGHVCFLHYLAYFTYTYVRSLAPVHIADKPTLYCRFFVSSTARTQWAKGQSPTLTPSGPACTSRLLCQRGSIEYNISPCPLHVGV